jgi:lipoprotein-releasing system permease protein
VQLLPRLAIALLCACNSKPAAPGTSTPGSSGAPASVLSSSGAAGSAQELRDKVAAVNSHAVVLKSVVEFAEYRDVLGVVEHTENVVSAEPFIFVEVNIASVGHEPIGVALKGVDPQRVAGVLDLGTHLKVGKLADLATGEPPAILLGDVLATTLAVRPGDRVTVLRPQIGSAPKAEPTHEYVFRVAGTFHIGFDEYDDRLAFASLAAVQKVVDRGDEVMGIEFKVKDIAQSDKVARALETKLGSPYRVMDWYELNKRLFTTLFGDRRP